jgi:hypothetical protein
MPAWRPLDGSAKGGRCRLPAHHLVTHGVVVGMTGSGKTGLLTVLVEEALRTQVPVLVIDVKGDLPNLLLSFPTFASAELLPWADATALTTDGRSRAEIATELAEERRRGLAAWSVGEPELAAFSASTLIRVITPGSSARKRFKHPQRHGTPVASGRKQESRRCSAPARRVVTTRGGAESGEISGQNAERPRRLGPRANTTSTRHRRAPCGAGRCSAKTGDHGSASDGDRRSVHRWLEGNGRCSSER